MYGKGIDARFFSRANDRRRGGFLESQGGGTILVTRGDIAEKLGLPVAAVVGFIHSYADGAHTSIPAPGLGALAAGLGGKDHRDGSLAYYFSEPVVCNDAKGVGPLVLAYTEMIARK